MAYKAFHLLCFVLQLKWETRTIPSFQFNRPSRKCNSSKPLHTVRSHPHEAYGGWKDPHTDDILPHSEQIKTRTHINTSTRSVQRKLILSRISSPKLGRLEYYFLQFYMLELNSAQPLNLTVAYNEKKWKVFSIYTNFRFISYSPELKEYNTIRRKIIKFA